MSIPGRPICSVSLAAILLLVVIFILAAPIGAAEQFDDGDVYISQKTTPSFFKHLFVSNGFLFGPLMLLATLGIVCLVVLLAFTVFGDHKSLVSQAVAAGSAQLPHGIEEARHAASAVIERWSAPKERALRWLATLAVLSPLIGLLGTLFGASLACIHLAQSDPSVNRAAFAQGLGHALAVVLEGVFLSIVAVIAGTILKNRLARLTLETRATADITLTRAKFGAE